jgi:hypothetical protein
MTKTVEEEPVKILAAYMVEVNAPTLSATVNRPRIAFNICYSLKGREFARKKDPETVCEDSPEERSALCADIGEAKGRKVTGSRMNVERFRFSVLHCINI